MKISADVGCRLYNLLNKHSETSFINPCFIYRIIFLIQFYGATEILEITNAVIITKCDRNVVL